MRRKVKLSRQQVPYSRINASVVKVVKTYSLGAVASNTIRFVSGFRFLVICLNTFPAPHLSPPVTGVPQPLDVEDGRWCARRSEGAYACACGMVSSGRRSVGRERMWRDSPSSTVCSRTSTDGVLVLLSMILRNSSRRRLLTVPGRRCLSPVFGTYSSNIFFGCCL